MELGLLLAFIIIIVCLTIRAQRIDKIQAANSRNANQENDFKECSTIGTDYRMSRASKESSSVKNCILKLWSCICFTIAACAVICFASTALKSIEIKVTHQIHHDFGGNLHKPITIQLSDCGYPVKVEVTNR